MALLILLVHYGIQQNILMVSQTTQIISSEMLLHFPRSGAANMSADM